MLKMAHHAAIGSYALSDPQMDFPQRMTADQIVDEIKRQFRPLAERGYKPEVVEMSEQYAAKLDSRFLRAHILTISLDERDEPAFSGVPIRHVQSPGILRVIA